MVPFVRNAIDNLRAEAHGLEVLATALQLPIHATCLLRHSFAHKLRHLARTTTPHIMEDALKEFDDLVANTMLNILGEGRDGRRAATAERQPPSGNRDNRARPGRRAAPARRPESCPGTHLTNSQSYRSDSRI